MASSRVLQLRSCISTSMGSVRTYAAEAAKSSKAPIQLFGLSGRYAHAMFSAALKQKKLDVVEGDLKKFKATLKSDKGLRTFVSSPILTRSEKVNGINAALKKIGVSDLTSNLFVTMAENNRLSYAENIINSYSEIMSAQRGEVPCKVTTAKAMSDAQKQKLAESLKRFHSSNETLNISTTVDPTIIGGMIVLVGEKYIDMSVSSKLTRYMALLKESV